MAFLVNLKEVYNTYFQGTYTIPPKEPTSGVTVLGTPISENWAGREVFLPVRFEWDGRVLNIPCCTIRATNKKVIVKTVVSERKGTVKEQFNIGDWVFSIKGVLIGVGNNLPDVDMIALRDIYESTKPVALRNAISDLFLDLSCRVSVESLEFPEVEGKTLRHRPFTLTCESDFVETLKTA